MRYLVSFYEDLDKSHLVIEGESMEKVESVDDLDRISEEAIERAEENNKTAKVPIAQIGFRIYRKENDLMSRVMGKKPQWKRVEK